MHPPSHSTRAKHAAPSFAVVLVLGSIPTLAGCRAADPPGADRDGSAAPLGAESTTRLESRPDTGGAPVASAVPAPADASAQPPAVDPGTLPQTHDKPNLESPAFQAGARALFDAIVKDDPDVAMGFFFPVTAYEQVKAIPSPAGDWKHRLVAAYKRDIHALHKRLSEASSRARFVRLDVPENHARWVEPNEETNKLGYYRVYGTRLVYEVDGKERSEGVSSLISWRGEWYVVHLTGFK